MALDAQISVRLPEGLATKLEETASVRGVDRSDLVRDALRLYLEGAPGGERPWDRVGDLAGAARDGPSDLGARHRARLREILDGG